MQFQSDVLGIEIERPLCVETTALGAAYLAGLSAGVYSSIEEIKKNREIEKSFSPNISDEERNKKMSLWKKAVGRSLLWKE